jgi:hypothetical protein
MLPISHPYEAVTREKNSVLTYHSLELSGIPSDVAGSAIFHFHALEGAFVLPRPDEVGLETALQATLEFARAQRMEVEARLWTGR